MNAPAPHTVGALIAHLQQFPPNMPVAIRMYSEQRLLEAGEVEVETLCEPREDGWIQHFRPDMRSTQYLVFPGN